MSTSHQPIPPDTQVGATHQGWTSLLDVMTQGVILVGPDGRYLEVNPAGTRILGLDRESLLASGLAGRHSPLHGLDGKVIDREAFPSAAALRTGLPVPRQVLGWVRAGGETLWLEFSANPLPGGSVLVCFDDLTELHVKSRKLERLTQLYAALSQVNQAIVWSPTREDLLDKICEVMVKFGHFTMAWIGWNDPDRHEVRVVSRYGDRTGYLDGLEVRSDDTPLGRGGTGTAIREGRACVVNDFLSSADASPWHEAASRAGLEASASIPIRSGGKVCAALVVYASVKQFFGPQELALLEEAAGDVTFALENHEHETQRKQMEEALKESEYFFRESQRTAAIGSYKVDFTTGMWKSSEVLDTIFGIGATYHRSVQGWLDLVHPEDRAALDQYLRQEVLAGTTPFSREYRIIRKNTGETRWVSGLGEVRIAPDGTPLSMTGTIQDITGRKSAEAMLLDSQARLQRAERVANFGHWQINLDDRVVLASEGARMIYGLEGAEWSIQTIQELPVPEHRPMLQAALAGLVDHRQPYNVEFQIRRSTDGQVRDIHSMAEYDPARRVVFGVINDITERKQAENALRLEKTFTRALLDNQIEGVVACDGNGELVLFNRTLARWQGMDALQLPREQWAEHYDLFEADGATPLATEAIPLVRAFGGEVIHDVGLVICAKNQPPRHVLCNGSPILDECGRRLGAVVVMHDITRQRHDSELLRSLNQNLEQRVQARTAQLEAANQEMEAFSYSVSHDLRAPLRSIDGFSQVLLEDYQDQVDEAGRHYLTRIRLGAQRMGNLIDDLLKLSKTSRSELKVSECDLSAVCGRVAADLANLDPGRRVELRLQPDMRVQADPSLMQVVFQNLLGNAWKFTSRRDRPRIEVAETASPQGERTFFVRDNGAGFDMAHAGKLFSAFQRLHSPAEFEGTGIGLAIVQRIIHRHGGRIWAESEPGQGATLFFTLGQVPSGSST